jgi:hypothetical protein
MGRADGVDRAAGMTDVPAPPRRLPIDVVIKRSFLYAWESRAVLAAPYAIYVIVTVLADLLLGESAKSANSLRVYLLTGVEEVFAMAFAVGIHRFTLLHEVHAGIRFFRWDRHFLQYLLTALVLFLLLVVAAFPAIGIAGGAAGPAGSGLAGASALFGLAFMVTAALILSRMALALPSAALGDGTSFRTIWDMTRGNGLRLLAVSVMTVLPFMAIQAGLISLLPAADSPAATGFSAREIVVTIVWGVISPLQLIVITVMLSLCYDALVRGGGPPVVEAGR